MYQTAYLIYDEKKKPPQHIWDCLDVLFPSLRNNSVALFFQCLSAKQVKEKELSAALAITPHLMKGLVTSLRLHGYYWQQFNSRFSQIIIHLRELYVHKSGPQSPTIVRLVQKCTFLLKLCFVIIVM